MNPSTDPAPLPMPLRILQRLEFPRKLGLCERLFASGLARQGIRWVRTAPGPVWKLDLANSTHRWIVYGCYEGPGFWRWLRAHGDGIRSIVDSGANIGQTALYFARGLPRARILAYEPGAAARQWLAEGVERNRFSQITIEPLGLSSAPGPASLGAAGPESLHGSWNRIGGEGGEPVSLATLDGELDRHGLATLDLWKLDVEGHTAAAIRGAGRAIAGRRIRAIHMELDDTSEESAALLRAAGYTAWNVCESGRLEPLRDLHEWGNALFLSADHPAAARP